MFSRTGKVGLAVLRCAGITAAVAAAMACGGPAPEAPAAGGVDPATAAVVHGRVVVDGTPPSPVVLRLDGDPKCVDLRAGTPVMSARHVVDDDGALANVFVYVREGDALGRHAFPVPSEPVVLDQQRCWYEPRVVGVRVGQRLEVRNSDPLLHNVRADAAVNQGFNIGQPVEGMRNVHTFTTREVMVPFKCDVHAWMQAWVGVLEHPFFAVTGADGRFSLDGLPPGAYTIEAWHEALGRAVQTVTLEASDRRELTFKFAIS
jgi:plastocyanin